MGVKEAELKNQPHQTIDKIREIIFGDEIKTLHDRIIELKSAVDEIKKHLTTIEQKQAELANHISNNEHGLTDSQIELESIRHSVEKVKDEINSKIKKLTEQKVDKTEIGQAFIEWGMKVKQEHDK